MTLEDAFLILKHSSCIELSTYMRAVEVIEKEFEAHKKALELACRKLGEYSCIELFDRHECDGRCGTHWHECLLQKAREL